MSYFLRQRWWAIAIAALFLMNAGTLAFFWVTRTNELPATERGHATHRGGPPRFIPDQLQFTEAQLQQYDQLFDEHQRQVRSLKDSIRESKENLFELLRTNNPGADEIEKRAAKAAEYQEKLDVLTFQHFNKVKSICTPAQQKKFETIIQTVARQMAPPPPPPPHPDDAHIRGEDMHGNDEAPAPPRP